MKLTVIGLGLIGGSLALDLRSKNFAASVIGVDENDEHCQQARNRGLVDEIQKIEKAVVGADLVILAVPVDAILRLLPKVLDLIGADTTVTDMGSTKSAIVQSVKSHSRRAQFVASHPMAGTEHSGPLAALRGLFADRTAVICDAEASNPRDLRRVDEMFEVLKMRTIHMSAEEHDLHTAYISHLSHISSFVLANTVLAKEKNVSTIFDLAGGGFESTVRLAKSSPAMWSPIFEQNLQNISDALGTYIEQLTEFHGSLKAKNFSKTKIMMNGANEIGRVLQNIGNRGDKKKGSK
jgi:prephenate dehydrogenase